MVNRVVRRFINRGQRSCTSIIVPGIIGGQTLFYSPKRVPTVLVSVSFGFCLLLESVTITLYSAPRLTIFGASTSPTLPRRVYFSFSKNKRNFNLDCFEAHFDRSIGESTVRRQGKCLVQERLQNGYFFSKKKSQKF